MESQNLMKIATVAISLVIEKVTVKTNQSLKERNLHATSKVINHQSVEHTNGILEQDQEHLSVGITTYGTNVIYVDNMDTLGKTM